MMANQSIMKSINPKKLYITEWQSVMSKFRVTGQWFRAGKFKSSKDYHKYLD